MKTAVADISPERWERTPDAAQALVVTWHAQLGTPQEQIAALEAPLWECATHQAQIAALQAQVTVLQAEVRELRARLWQDSFNSSRPPSSDLPQPLVKPSATSSGRKCGGQPGHRGTFRALLSPEQVGQVVVVLPEVCRHCGQAFPSREAMDGARPWRHQMVELLPLAVRVTEYQMVGRWCAPPGRGRCWWWTRPRRVARAGPRAGGGRCTPAHRGQGVTGPVPEAEGMAAAMTALD